MEGLIFVIIAGLISMFFNKDKNKDEQKTARKKLEQQAKKMADNTEWKAKELSAPSSHPAPAPAPKTVQNQETRHPRPRLPVSRPVQRVDEWRDQDFLNGIILSEVLGPPKSKRKK
ncbi:hypothetical protein BTO30_05400 [Domibacillus antri]|uniref:Uncharacterized protein n=1 Tax=Domibacillus antri TaxID=1714264 RepID=A0A1Q8Q7T4_9BACI|nr:hypothetical protein [Domibacillus antri]OLN23399.1 hypothetical protein BTO30_05400 [Domibacillus antri]